MYTGNENSRGTCMKQNQTLPVQRYSGKQRGAALVEYCCALLFICVVAIPGVQAFASELSYQIDNSTLALADAFGGGTQSRTLVPQPDAESKFELDE